MSFFHGLVVSTTGNALTSGLPATLGDRLFCYLAADATTPWVGPSGTTLRGVQVQPTLDGQQIALYEIDGGITAGWLASPPTGYNFTGPTADVVAILFTVSNCGSGQNLIQTNDNASHSTPFSIPLNGVATTPRSCLIALCSLDCSGTGTGVVFGGGTWTGTTLTAQTSSQNGNVTFSGICSLDNAPASSNTGTVTVPVSGTVTAAWAGWLLSIPDTPAGATLLRPGKKWVQPKLGQGWLQTVFIQPGAVSGSGSSALSPFDSSGVGSESYSASVAAAMSSFAATSVGAISISGSGSIALSPFAGSGVGVEGSAGSGSGSAALSPFADSGTGLETYTGSGSAALSPFAGSGVGVEGSSASGSGSAALSPFADSGTGLETYTSTGSVALSPFASLGSSGLPAARVALTALASHGSGPLTNPWSNGEPRIVKDVGGNRELIGFGWSDKLYIFKSADNGDTWSFVDPTASESIGTVRILCATQDSTGKCHIIYVDGPGGVVQYARITLSYTSGAVTGFASAVKNVTLPGTYNTSVDVRATILAVPDALGTETIVYHISTNVTGGTFTVDMGKATSLSPTVTADFVKLDGTSGATSVFSTTGFNNHDHCSFVAQLGSTSNMWVFWGPTDAEFGGRDGTFTTRVLLTASSHTWSVGSPITMVGQDLVTTPEAMCVYGTANYVWFMYLDPTDGLSFDRVNASGAYTHRAITSPDAGADCNGWGVFTVAPDETRVWAFWNIIANGGPGVNDRTAEGFWNGSSWTIDAETSSVFKGDSWGVGGTVKWDEGLVATRLDGSTLAISLTTIRGGSIVSALSGSGSAALSPFAGLAVGLETYTGSGSASRASFAASGSGVETFSGTGAAALSPFAGLAVGLETYTSTGSAVVSPFAGAGLGLESYTSTGAAGLSPFAGLAVGLETYTSTGTAARLPFATSGVGNVGALSAGSGSAAMASFASSGAGLESYTSVGGSALGSFASTGTGLESYTSVGAALWSAFASSGTGTVSSTSISGSGSAALQAFASLGVGSVVSSIGYARVTISQRTDTRVTIKQRRP